MKSNNDEPHIMKISNKEYSIQQRNTINDKENFERLAIQRNNNNNDSKKVLQYTFRLMLTIFLDEKKTSNCVQIKENSGFYALEMDLIKISTATEKNGVQNVVEY